MPCQFNCRPLALFSFCLIAIAVLLSGAQTAHAKKSVCGGLNQKACPKFLPGPQCKKGLKKVGKYCRAKIHPPVKPGKKCGALNQLACPNHLPGPQCNKGLRKIGKYCRTNLTPPVKPGKKCGTLNRRACPGNRCSKTLVAIRGICRRVPNPPGGGNPPGDSAGNNSSIAKKVKSVANKNTEQIRILNKFRKCMKRNKKALNKAARGRDTGSANRIKGTCLSAPEQRTLKNGKSSGGGNLRFRSLSVGLGADIAAFFGAGADAGFVWDLDGNLPTRLFLSGASGGGVRGGAGADLAVGLNTDQNTSGVSRYFGGSLSVDVGVSVGVTVVTARIGNFFQAPVKGIEVSAGVGVGFNAGSVDKIKTRIFRRSCRNVVVNVTNTGNKKIRILDLNYFDRGKRRSEPTPNRTVKPGETLGVWKRPHNLEKVGYERTQLEVVYRYKGEKKSKRLPSGTCRDNKRYAVSLP